MLKQELMSCQIFFNLGQAVRNYLEKTSPKALEILVSSTHDLNWNSGPFGEGFGSNAFLFVNSSETLDSVGPCDDSEDPGPLPNEPFISLDWNLVLTEAGQEMLFTRVRNTFDKTTAMVPAIHKKKYRLSPDELLRVRNVIALFDQIQGHLASRISPSALEEWKVDVQSGSKRDEDLLAIFTTKPARFALSMLLSEQQKAKVDMEEAEQRKVETKEVQRQEVQAAQWSYFKGALQRDQERLLLVQAAPKLVKQKLHAKTVAHRARQAADGEAACKNYQASVGKYVFNLFWFPDLWGDLFI